MRGIKEGMSLTGSYVSSEVQRELGSDPTKSKGNKQEKAVWKTKGVNQKGQRPTVSKQNIKGA